MSRFLKLRHRKKVFENFQKLIHHEQCIPILILTPGAFLAHLRAKY